MAAKPPPSPTQREQGAEGDRIAKFLARAGVASRRQAEQLIEAGRVSVNGEAPHPSRLIGPADVVRVDGAPVAVQQPRRLWRYHKPEGLVTTHKDPQGRPTVFAALPPELPRVISIGRLDLNSEGLLLLTNDGALARQLELPDTGWIRRYRVRVFGTVDPGRLAGLVGGITVEGVRYGPITAALDSQAGNNSWLSVGLKEGRNREIRKVMTALGLSVTRLIRIGYGPFQLGLLPRGAVEEITGKVLREQLPRVAPPQ